jgi:putative endonuclease
MYYVYLLKSKKDEKFYIGYSSDLKKRITQHKAGEVTSTSHRLPVELVYYESYTVETLARDREMKLKQFGSAYTALLKRLHYK